MILKVDSLIIVLLYHPPKPFFFTFSQLSKLLTLACSVFDCFNLSQHVHFPTHSNGHNLDLICTSGVGICSIYSSDTGIYDHKLIDFNFSLPIHVKSVKTVISYRNCNNVDISLFCSSIVSSNLSDVLIYLLLH